MPNIIEVECLAKQFGTCRAVDGISFAVKEGEVFALLGPNGAGKSTTIKMLTTQTKPTKGRMRVNGADPVEQPDAVRRSFGIVFQGSSLDEELTAQENLDFHGALYSVPKKSRSSRIDALLTLVGLLDRRNSIVREFSGGMKRRLEIARGLLHRPKILFLDEPTLGLDPQTRHHIWRYMLDLNKTERTTIFFTTHNMEEAERVAQSTAIIDHGTIVALGSVAELKSATRTDCLEAAYLKFTGSAIRP